MTQLSEQVLPILCQDHVYSGFLNDSFNLQNAISLINKLPFNEQLAKITTGIEYVKQNINQLTSQNCEDFFKQTSKLDELYEELQFISIKSQNLKKTLDLMKTKLETPYQQLFRQIFLISRLQKTCDLLRKMLRIIHLIKRVKECNINSNRKEQTIFLKEIIKISQYINEIDLITLTDSEKLLFKLNLIKNDLKKIDQIKLNLNEEADKLLKNGLKTSDTNLIATAFQVYHNLNILNEKIENFYLNRSKILSEEITELFRNLTCKDKFQSSSISTRKSNVLRSNLRNTIKLALETSIIQFNQISISVRILKKKRDNSTQNLLIEFISNKNIIFDFWNEMIKNLTETLNKFSYENMLLKQLFELDYPKTLALITDFDKQISTDESMIVNEKPLRSIISQFESAYLSNSLSALFDSVNRMFSQAKSNCTSSNYKVVSVPSEKDVEIVIKDILNELSIVSMDSQLSNSMCKNVLKTINLFMVKCEHLACVDGDSTQVIGPFTTSQRHNALIVHILVFFANSLKTINNGDIFPVCVKENITESFKSMENLILTIIEPLINSVQDAIEAIILTLHNEDFNNKSNGKNETNCSLYMKELQRFIARVSQDYFKQFPDCEVIQKRIFKMAAHTIDLFVLHNCLQSPVSNKGRNQMSVDFVQLEIAILPICQRIGDLGKSFQILRAFRTLLTISPEEICKSSVVGSLVPYHLVLHFLISNYAPDEIMSPLKYKGWSVTRYSKWLEQRSSEEEKLTFINEILDLYVKHIRKSQKKTFDPIYPLLVETMRQVIK